MSIDSSLCTLEQLTNREDAAWCFNVPIYQRLYVWGDDQIKTLLTDMANAFDRRDTQFFLGGTLLVEKTTAEDRDQGVRRFDLIDGQQRVTALMAALLGREVLTKDYETVRVRIAFHPQEEKFEVANPAIEKDPSWIPDVATVFHPEASLSDLTRPRTLSLCLAGNLPAAWGYLGNAVRQEPPARQLVAVRFEDISHRRGPFGSTTSDSERTMVRLETTRILAVVISFLGSRGLSVIVERAAASLSKYCAAAIEETGVVE